MDTADMNDIRKAVKAGIREAAQEAAQEAEQEKQRQDSKNRERHLAWRANRIKQAGAAKEALR